MGVEIWTVNSTLIRHNGEREHQKLKFIIQSENRNALQMLMRDRECECVYASDEAIDTMSCKAKRGAMVSKPTRLSSKETSSTTTSRVAKPVGGSYL